LILLGVRFRTSSLLLVFALASCNLVNSDLTKVDVQLPVETYMVDTADPRNVHLPGSVPTVACSGDAACCPGSCQGDGFTLSCGAGSCQATVVAQLVAPVDLSTDPNVAKAKSLADVTLLSIEYGVCNNSLSVPTPQIEIWLAPETVTRADPTMGAKKLGTIPMVPAKTSVGCPPDPMHPDPTKFAKVMLEPDAQATFTSFAKDFKTKFNAIAVASFVVHAGEAQPTGSLTVLLSGVAQASLSL
jgi:hypothetical protein